MSQNGGTNRVHSDPIIRIPAQKDIVFCRGYPANNNVPMNDPKHSPTPVPKALHARTTVQSLVMRSPIMSVKYDNTQPQPAPTAAPINPPLVVLCPPPKRQLCQRSAMLITQRNLLPSSELRMILGGRAYNPQWTYHTRKDEWAWSLLPTSAKKCMSKFGKKYHKTNSQIFLSPRRDLLLITLPSLFPLPESSPHPSSTLDLLLGCVLLTRLLHTWSRSVLRALEPTR